MSKKKLWQAIGKESTQQHLSLEQENNTESIELADGREGTAREEVGVGGEGPAYKGREGELSIEIQSCESEKIRSSPSQPGNHDIPWCSSKFFVEKTFRKRIQMMGEQVRSLRADLVVVRGALASGQETQASELSALLNKFYNHFTKGQQNRTVMITCKRCEHSKALIDQLTRQCWELETKVGGQKPREGREELPMKRIENSLLQERAEAIRRLKAEVEELREENEALYGQVGAVQQRAREMESQYKNSLLTFKGEIEAINDACCRKIEQIIHEKAASESELRLLQEQYLDLQAACEQDQFKRTSQRRYFTQFPEDFSSPLPSPTSAQLHAAFAKHPPLKIDEIALTRKIAPRNTASLIDLDLSHWDPPTLYKGLPSNSRAYLDSTPQSRKSRNTSESSFGSALQKLAEIQKDVRKQINRSKKSFK